MADNEMLLEYEEEAEQQDQEQQQQGQDGSSTRRTLEAAIVGEVAKLIHPAAITQHHKHQIHTALQQHPTAENLEQLLAEVPDLFGNLINTDTPDSQAFPDCIPASQGTDINDDADYSVWEVVLENGKTPWVGNLAGARTHFYLPTVEEVLPLLNSKRRSFFARTGISFGFKQRSMHTRTKALVMCPEAVQWLGDALPGLKPHLSTLGPGRVVMWYDIPKHSTGLESTEMPVALSETSWMQAQLEQGEAAGFAGLELFPLPAIIYMMYYHPKVALPAAVGSIEQQRQQVFSKFSNKPGCSPQAAQDLEEMLTMLLRYMLV